VVQIDRGEPAAMIQNAGFRSAAVAIQPGGAAPPCQPGPLAPAQLPDRDRVQGHASAISPAKAISAALPAQRRPSQCPSGKASVPANPATSVTRVIAPRAPSPSRRVRKAKAGLVQAPRLRDPDHGPQRQPPGKRADQPQPRHAQRRQPRQPDQHLAAKAPVHQPPGKGRQTRHDQEGQRRPQRQLGLGPARRGLKVGQQAPPGRNSNSPHRSASGPKPKATPPSRPSPRQDAGPHPPAQPRAASIMATAITVRTTA
jgi:hypothetical protein